jgi:ornithine--oxo-acid transaminase
MMDIVSLLKNRLPETYDLHARCINPQFVRVLEVIGFKRNCTSGKGAWLVDAKGARVLDFLAGFGVFNIGRNHPVVTKVLHEMLDSDPPSMVQMDAGCISGLLAEALVSISPGDLDSVFFTNSGAEGVEGALKFARQATGRHKIVYCERAFHGLTLGALSVNADLFCQMITMPLMEQYNILTQVAGHGLDTVEILPPLVIERAEADYFLSSLDAVLAEAHRFPGAAWTTTINLALRTARSA